MMFDFASDLGLKTGLAPVSVSDNTAQVSSIMDLQNKRAVDYLILTGSIADADATFTVLVEESNASDMSGAVAVDDANLIFLENAAGFKFDDDSEVRKIGYRGSKRYIRVTITPANNASAALLAGIWVWRDNVQPVAEPT
jgi:hypothetical protein